MNLHLVKCSVVRSDQMTTKDTRNLAGRVYSDRNYWTRLQVEGAHADRFVVGAVVDAPHHSCSESGPLAIPDPISSYLQRPAQEGKKRRFFVRTQRTDDGDLGHEMTFT